MISHYRIVGPLCAGGMGEVYLAIDETLERQVALKILPPQLVKDEDRVRRFMSAIRFGGRPLQIVRAGLEPEIDFAISQPILDERLRVLGEKFALFDSESHRQSNAVAPSQSLNRSRWTRPLSSQASKR